MGQIISCLNICCYHQDLHRCGMHKISGYPIYPEGQFQYEFQYWKYSGYSEYSKICCTQDDHPILNLLGLSWYAITLQNLLFNSAITHQIGVGIFRMAPNSHSMGKLCPIWPGYNGNCCKLYPNWPGYFEYLDILGILHRRWLHGDPAQGSRPTQLKNWWRVYNNQFPTDHNG